MDIEDWRKQIDDIDAEILTLLNKRADCSIRIGNLKSQKNLPIYSPDREEYIIGRAAKENPGPLSDSAVQRIFERIIDESRKLEKDESKKLNQ